MVYTVVNQSSSNDRDDEDDSEGGVSHQQSKSGAGFWDLELELKALKTILTPASEWATKVYSACKPELFHHGITKSIFNRVKDLMDKAESFDLPTLDFVLSDSKLTPDTKQNLRESFYGSDGNTPVATVQSQGDYDILVKGLTSLAKTRAIYQATHKAANELLDSQEPTAIVKQITSSLGDSLFKFDSDDDMTNEIRMGVGYNQAAEDSFSRIINGSFDQLRIKTGFKEFDERTGGWHKTNLVIIGGNSGGGKSLLAINYLIRQFRLGYKVVLASYEMTEDECLIRILSNISEVDMNNIQNNRLTPPEVERVNAAWREFNLIGHQKGNYFNLICPRNETTVPEIGYRVRSLKPDVLILDYINLLAPSSGSDEAQWQALGNISRESKLLANKLNCVVVLLAQVDDAYNLRYSKGIKDHANFVTAFVRDDDAKETRLIKMKQLKARNAPLYDYDLNERFDIAQFRDPEQVDRAEWPDRDQLMMLELQCHQLGLKLEPTASKEFDLKKRTEAKQVVNNINVEEPMQEKESEVVMTPPPPNLLFSGDDAIPQDFSKSYVKSTFDSLLKKENAMYEDTV